MSKVEEVLKIITEGFQDVRPLTKIDNVSKIVKFNVNTCVKIMKNLMKQSKLIKNHSFSAEIRSFKHYSVVISRLQWVGMELSRVVSDPKSDHLPFVFGMLVKELINITKNLDQDRVEVQYNEKL